MTTLPRRAASASPLAAALAPALALLLAPAVHAQLNWSGVRFCGVAGTTNLGWSSDLGPAPTCNWPATNCTLLAGVQFQCALSSPKPWGTPRAANHIAVAPAGQVSRLRPAVIYTTDVGSSNNGNIYGLLSGSYTSITIPSTLQPGQTGYYAIRIREDLLGASWCPTTPPTNAPGVYTTWRLNLPTAFPDCATPGPRIYTGPLTFNAGVWTATFTHNATAASTARGVCGSRIVVEFFFDTQPITQLPPPAASPADIASIGGDPMPDGLITGDDFLAFINAFAAAEPPADIASVGGLPFPDGLITGDDFITFINAFASAV